MPIASAPLLSKVEEKLNSVLLGQAPLVRHFLAGILAGGHILLEGLPGLGKTQLVRAFAGCAGLDMRRIQFTPDLLPMDITGSSLLRETAAGKVFEFHPGPIFTHLVLADEVNRASPKTQAALLEAMQERQVTVLGETRPLPHPFVVLATQNPIELEGTYPLPEAQLDRFLFKLNVSDVDGAVLRELALGHAGDLPPPESLFEADDLILAIQQTRSMALAEAVADYMARLVLATRPESGSGLSEARHVKFGASPRAVLGLAAAARAWAALDGRDTVGFEDVQAIAPAVLRHRIILDYRARLEGITPDGVVAEILDQTPVLVPSAPQSLAARLAAGM